MSEVMRPELLAEIAKLKAFYAAIEMPFRPTPGATEEMIAGVESKVGMHFDADLRAFWKYSNGTRDTWFAILSDELTGCSFSSIENAMKDLDWCGSEAAMAQWKDDRPSDRRIKSGFLHRRLWFPIAEFNNFSTSLYFDADPSPDGRYGQIIVYQHDPDAVYYVADSFIEMFQKSNDLMASNITQLFFLEDEFERICHMKGVEELERQLKAGLHVDKPNWENLPLRAKAIKCGRKDIVEFLDRRKSP